MIKRTLPIIALSGLSLSFEILTSNEANQFLVHNRHKRGNQFGEETFKPANIQRECEQEVCNYEEMLEYAENQFKGRTQEALDWTENYYAQKTKQCHIKPRCNIPTTKTCINKWNDHQCICEVGYTGEDCLQDIDECEDPNFCNGGTCNNLLGNFECFCNATETGARCEEDFDECSQGEELCGGNGVCINERSSYDPKGYSCDCQEGWSGEFCEEDVDECEDDPCRGRDFQSNKSFATKGLKKRADLRIPLPH